MPAHEAAQDDTAMRAERRIVTALFVDIADSTSITERLDPEDVRDMIGGAVALVIEQVDALGGTVKDLAGDGVLALFGAPVAHEDDAERAVVCGLRVVQSMTTYADEVARRWSVDDFAVRLGIETGPAVLGPVGTGSRVEYGAVGDAVNTAARLQGEAEPGMVLVGAETKAMVEGRFAWGPDRPLVLKGKSTPIHASPALSYAPNPVAVDRLVGAPLVGRDDELAHVVRRIEALADGHGSVLVVVGDPGVGKSRLVAESRSRSDGREGLWLEAAALSYAEAIPYQPYRHLVLAWLGIPLDAPQPQVSAAIEERCHALPAPVGDALRVLEPMITGGTGDDPAGSEAAQRRLFGQVRTFVDALAAVSPVTLVLEDLHWSDATSIALTEHLAPLTMQRPLLLVLTLRPEKHAVEAAARLADAVPDQVLRVDLATLDGGGDKELLHSLLHGAVVPRPLEHRLLDVTGGNPLFLEEQVRGLMTSGALARVEGGGLRFAGEAAFELEPTLERALVARIDRLVAAAREVLLAAAVLGLRFDTALLDALVGRDAKASLADLVDEQILVADDSGNRSYRFRHALVQEATYRSILRRQRRDLHSRAAVALEEAYAGREDEIAATLGRHLAVAGDTDRAVGYLLTAVDRAVSAYANAEAATLASDALELLGADAESLPDDRRPVARDLFMVRGRALHRQARRAEAVEALRGALRLSPVDDPLAIAEVRTTTGQVLRDDHRFDEALAEFDAADACIGTRFLDDAGFAAWLDTQLARGAVFYWQGDLVRYNELLERVEPYIEDRADTDQRLRFYDSVRTVMLRRDRYHPSDELLRLDRMAYDAGLASPQYAQRAWAAFMHGFTVLWHRDLALAEQLLQESLSASEQLGDSLLRARSLTYLMVAARMRGEVDRAAVLVDPAVEAARDAGLAEYEAMATATEAWVAYRRGDLDTTVAKGRSAMESWESLPGRYFLDWMACVPLVAVALAHEDVAGAVGWARPMLAETQQRLGSPFEDRLRSAIAAAEAGDEATARAELDEALRAAGRLSLV